MNEQMPDLTGPEDKSEGQQIEEGKDMSADFVERHPELVETPKEEVSSSPEIVELEGMISDFESKHSVEELFAISDLAPEDAPNHPTREPARLDLVKITEKLKYMATENKELKVRVKSLSQAVGIINRGKVDHTR